MTEHTPWDTGKASDDTMESYHSKIASHYTGALQYPDNLSLELVSLLDKLLEPTISQRVSNPDTFRAQGWLQVVNWGSLDRMEVAAPHGPEAQKHLSEMTSAGASKCLPAAPYTGDKRWYEGFLLAAADEAASALSGGGKAQRPSFVADATGTPLNAPLESDRKKGGSFFGKKKKEATI